jgi:hypothetical protein
MPDDDFDVYVSEHAITEVCRTPHITTLQAHGEEWSAQPIVNIHGDSLGPPKPRLSPPAPEPKLATQKNVAFWLAFCVAVIAACWLLSVVTR